MPWKAVSLMDAREEFCRLASQEGRQMRELCRRYEISPTTGYQWLRRYQAAGRVGLADVSRRPHHSPSQIDAALEDAVLAVRTAHPTWGGRKIRAVLLRAGGPSPSASTITAILTRHGCLAPGDPRDRQAPQRFEAPYPHALWQMDFKGHFPLVRGGRCHPLTVLDDHSRFNLTIHALGTEHTAPVQAELTRLFQRYGLPNRILCDNGAPWGSSGLRTTTLGVWLLRLDVGVIHGRPYHPATQGKEERFHRTLVTDLLATTSFGTLDEAQQGFDHFRASYNHERPHEAIGLVPPSSRYHLSGRAFPATLPAVEYDSHELVRRVTTNGRIKLAGHTYPVGEAFTGYPVAIRPSEIDGIEHVYFRHYPVATIDRR
jgi:transposase InsO family protein